MTKKKKPSRAAQKKPKASAQTKTPARGARASSSSQKKNARRAANKKKRAPSRRARMSVDERSLTEAETAILDRMAALSPGEPRYGVLEAALAFKASWVVLGERLHEVYAQKLYKPWGYGTFARYCADEVHVSTATARKLVRSYGWLGEEAPDLLPSRARTRDDAPRLRPIPDLATVEVLADARKAVVDDRVTEDAYLALKRAALDGDKSASVLRQAFKDALPVAPLPPPDPVRALRRALTTSVKTIEALREWDGNDALLVQAETLRDEIARHLPKRAGDVDDAMAA